MTKLNKKLGITSRAVGKVTNGKVTIEKILSYDLVADPGFDYRNKRQKLLEERKKKINILNNLANN